MSDKCTCVNCPDCDGYGHVWYSFSGEYLGSHRSDDLDEMRGCDNCGGMGISEECDYCREQRELAESEEQP